MLSYLAVAKQELGGPIWYPKFIKVGYMFWMEDIIMEKDRSNESCQSEEHFPTCRAEVGTNSEIALKVEDICKDIKESAHVIWVIFK